jgi:hypothetical protein
MIKNKKKLLLPLIFIFLGISLLSSVFALENYDQRVYKVGTAYPTYSVFSDQDIHLEGRYEDWEKVNTPYYTHSGMEDMRKGVFGDYVKEYSASVTNRGRIGRYYTVIFELRDMYGYKFSQSVTKYLRAGERKKFVYRDIQYESDEILSWGYRVVPGR